MHHVWERLNGGPAGRFSLEGLDRVFELFSTHGGSQMHTTSRNCSKTHIWNHPEPSATRYISN